MALSLKVAVCSLNTFRSSIFSSFNGTGTWSTIVPSLLRLSIFNSALLLPAGAYSLLYILSLIESVLCDVMTGVVVDLKVEALGSYALLLWD